MLLTYFSGNLSEIDDAYTGDFECAEKCESAEGERVLSCLYKVCIDLNHDPELEDITTYQPRVSYQTSTEL
jgi:hypothetical protein